MTTHDIRPDVRGFLDMMLAYPRPSFSNENIAELRPQAAGGMALIDLPIGELGVIQDVTMPGPGGELPLRLFDARESRPAGPVVVFFHGGGFVIGDLDTHASICAEVSRSLDLPVVAVDYRLAPEHPWPAAHDDGEAAVRWISANGFAFNREFTSVVLCGDSAGATLSLVAAIALRDVPGPLAVELVISMYPAADISRSYPSNDLFANGFALDRSDTDWYREAFNADTSVWRGSPLLADLADFPPTVLATAGLDPLRDQGRAFAAKLVEAGVPTTFYEAKGMIHGFANYRQVIPSAQADLAAVLSAAHNMLASDRVSRFRANDA